MGIFKKLSKLFGTQGLSKPVCDVCGTPTAYNDGYSLTTEEVICTVGYWEYVLTGPIADVRHDPMSVARYATQQAAHNTGWLVCEKCSKLFEFDRHQAKEYAQKRMDPPNAKSINPQKTTAPITIAQIRARGF